MSQGKQNLAWHKEAVTMRERGMSFEEIGEHFSKSKVSAWRAVRAFIGTAGPEQANVLSQEESEFIEPHKPHVIRKIIDRSAYAAAFRDWFDGIITRDQMMKRITA